MDRTSVSLQDLRGRIEVSLYERLLVTLHSPSYAMPSLWFPISTSNLLSISTANGNIFYITSKSQAISIKSFDINMEAGTAPLEIHFLPDTDPGYKSTSYPYQLIYTGDITGQGKGSVTTLPDLASPVVIPPATTYSFYITVANLYSPTAINYNFGTQVGDIVAEDDNLSIGEGYAMGYPFLGYSAPRRWNGTVK